MFVLLLRAAAAADCLEFWPHHYTCESEICKLNGRVNATCKVSERRICNGNRTLEREINCTYCWQLPETNLRCFFSGVQCKPGPRPQAATCSALPTVECLGNRTFLKQMYCKSSSGFSLTTAIALSVVFGGFGADRFYLGHITTGVLKLLSFGGFGIWSLIDVIFLVCGALTPKDGTLFKERVDEYL